MSSPQSSELETKEEEEEETIVNLWENLMSKTDAHELRLKIKTNEAGRIYNILEATAKNIEYLSRLSYLRENRVHCDKSSIRPDLKEVLVDYYRLYRKVSDLLEVDEAPVSIDEEIKSMLDEIMKKCEAINWETVVVLRPQNATDVKGAIVALNELRLLWRSNIKELMDYLQKTPEEVSQDIKFREEHEEEKKRNAQTLERLKEDFNNIVETKDNEIKEKQKVLDQLLRKITLVDQYYSGLIERHENTVEYEIEDLMSESRLRVEQYERQRKAVDKELDALKNAHAKTEGLLRHKRVKLIMDTEATIHKYDEAMLDLQLRYDTLLKEYNDEVKQREELEENLKEVAEEYKLIEQEREYMEQMEQAQEQLKKLMFASSIKIQAWWRGTLHRMIVGLFIPGDKEGNPSKKVELDKVDPTKLLAPPPLLEQDSERY